VDLTLHGTDEQLENYALGRLSRSAIPALEEHLLVCADCLDQLDRFEAFALGMKQALSRAEPRKSGMAEWFTKFGFAGAGFDFLKRPAFALGLAAATFAAIMIFFGGEHRKFVPVASVQLMAIRGDMPFVPEAREMDLLLADAPAGGPFRIEVVDATGNALWNRVASGAAGGISVKIQRLLAPGDYFVRLYRPDNRVMHEYGFRVRNQSVR
jgi:hypothetical protein